jgi:hypothetical protein
MGLSSKVTSNGDTDIDETKDGDDEFCWKGRTFDDVSATRKAGLSPRRRPRESPPALVVDVEDIDPRSQVFVSTRGKGS